MIQTSVGFTDVGLSRISESVRAYAMICYAMIILSSQASAMSSIDIENLASSLTAQSAFLNNFENVNPKVDIQEDVIDTKTLSDQIKELVVERISSLKEKIKLPTM